MYWRLLCVTKRMQKKEIKKFVDSVKFLTLLHFLLILASGVWYFAERRVGRMDSLQKQMPRKTIT